MQNGKSNKHKNEDKKEQDTPENNTELDKDEKEIPQESEEEKLRRDNEELKRQIAEFKDALLRNVAESENFKKRLVKEQQKAIEYANEKIIMDLLPTIDNFRRAVESGKSNVEKNSFYEGILMIEKEFLAKLEGNWGLKGFDSLNLPFDPKKHEAFSVEEKDDIDEEKVIEEFQKGYMLKEKIIRTAKVKVGKPKEIKNEKENDNN